MADTAVGEYIKLEQAFSNIESAVASFVVHYKELKDMLAAINADPTLKADITTVGTKGHRSYASFGTVKTKAKKIRDLMNTEFPGVVTMIEESIGP